MLTWNALRERKGLSFATLCKKTNLDFVTVWNIARGRTLKPWFSTIVKLAKAFGIDPSFVMREVEELTPEERKGLGLD